MPTQARTSSFSNFVGQSQIPESLRLAKSQAQNRLKQLLVELAEYSADDPEIFRAAIILVDENTGFMSGFVCEHISEARMKAISNFIGHLFTDSSKKGATGVAGHSAAREKTIMLPDLRNDPEKLFIDFPNSSKSRDKGILCSPVLSQQYKSQKSLAVISITSTRPNVFTEKHRELVEEYARFLYRPVLLWYIYNIELNDILWYNKYPINKERAGESSFETQKHQIEKSGVLYWHIEQVYQNWSGWTQEEKEAVVQIIADGPLGDMLRMHLGSDHEGNIEASRIIKNTKAAIKDNERGVHENTQLEHGLDKLEQKGFVGVDREEFRNFLRIEVESEAALEKRLGVFLVRLGKKLEKHGGVLRRRVIYDVVPTNKNK